jgi:hypothetical protein
MTPRPLARSLALVLLTIAAGIGVRFVRLSLPALVVKYGGSMLWAATIYWVVSTGFERMRLVGVAILAGVVATAVEFFKLYRSPGVDAFRGTLPGVLLLGRYFSGWDILAYWAAIAAAAALDGRLRGAAGRGEQ